MVGFVTRSIGDVTYHCCGAESEYRPARRYAADDELAGNIVGGRYGEVDRRDTDAERAGHVVAGGLGDDGTGQSQYRQDRVANGHCERDDCRDADTPNARNGHLYVVRPGQGQEGKNRPEGIGVADSAQGWRLVVDGKCHASGEYSTRDNRDAVVGAERTIEVLLTGHDDRSLIGDG